MFCRLKLKNEEKPEKRIKTKRNIKLILISIIVLIVIVGIFTYTKFFSAKENILTSISQQNKSFQSGQCFNMMKGVLDNAHMIHQ